MKLPKKAAITTSYDSDFCKLIECEEMSVLDFNFIGYTQVLIFWEKR